MSSVLAGKSGNRGRCSQPCRDRYLTTPEGNSFPLNLKDNSAYSAIKDIFEAGADSIKIEGRIKASDYVYTVVDCWRRHIQSFYQHGRINNTNRELYQVFNRDFSDGFLKGKISKELFIDNPMDNSIKQFSGIGAGSTNKQLLKEKEAYYENKEKISSLVKNKIEKLNLAKVPLEILVSGKLNTPLKVTVKSPDASFDVLSAINLVEAGTYTLNNSSSGRMSSDDQSAINDGNLHCDEKKRTAEHLSYKNLLDRLKAINSTEYYIEHLGIQGLQRNLFVPFKELTAIKKEILYILNGSRKFIESEDIPVLEQKSVRRIKKPTLAVLISSRDDLGFCDKGSFDVFYQLPNFIKDQCSDLVNVFIGNKDLVPWFPSVLIGENFTAAVDFLHRVQPKLIVTNNTGIAYEAFSRGIAWVAGPYLNIVNSFSLLCLKEKFNCCGSFISNEINANQLKRIKSPEKFKLYYSLYHPILLITSRQCLFHQVVGCEKTCIDDDCIKNCSKNSSIRRINQKPLFIEKSRGEYHCIYNNSNFLNTSIVNEIPDKFSGFLIDLREIKTETEISLEKRQIITLFENLLSGIDGSEKELKRYIHPSTNTQYIKGI